MLNWVFPMVWRLRVWLESRYYPTMQTVKSELGSGSHAPHKGAKRFSTMFWRQKSEFRSAAAHETFRRAHRTVHPTVIPKILKI